MRLPVFFCLLVCARLAAQEAEVPIATALPGTPFAIRNTWIIGGAGSWDYLTMDAETQRLYIAHGSQVQAVDVKTGAVAGQITGLREAHAIVFDNSGNFGYVSDGRANNVKVFDRSTLQIIATIPTIPNPRALVFEPRSGTLFAVCTGPAGASGNASTGCISQQLIPPRTSRNRPAVESSIAVVDAESHTALGAVLLPGRLGFAIGDGSGHIYVNLPESDRVLRLDAETIANLLREKGAENTAKPAPVSSESNDMFKPPAILDWSLNPAPGGDVVSFKLPDECKRPTALAIDGPHFRLFAACENWKLAVVNTITGAAVASVTTGPGTDAIAYDPNRELIFSANGGGYGSLTVIQQDANTDSYQVIQVLPTRERARTLAVDASNGEVYMVTDYRGVDLSTPAGIGTMKTAPVEGSFQVLDISR